MITTLPFCCGRLPLFLICFLFLGLLARSAQAQTPGSCGTDDYTQRLMQTDSAYRNFVRNAKAVQSTDKAANDAILTIPVLFVVYHLGEPVGQGSNVSEADLQRQINLMNRFFSAGSSAFKDNGATDTRIRFVMARRGPGCSPGNGVVRVDGRALPSYAAVGVDYLDLYKEDQLRNLAGDAVNQIGGQAVIVRVYWQVTGAAGWAGFGGDIRLSAPTMQSDDDFNSVLAHEMGHVLFLHHTFSGGDDNVNCPPNTNPNTQGDEVADTDPHLIRQPVEACLPASETMINGCTGRPFGRIGRNVMSYGCGKYIFTPGQIARMRGYLAGSLAGLANSSYALPPAPEQVVRAAACTPTSGVAATPTLYQTEGIARVQLGTLTNSTNSYGFVPLLRTDLSCGQPTVLRAGQSYSLAIDAPNNNQHRRVYIDWNNDGSFDEATERAFSTQIGDETGTITVPANAVTTQVLRMRVVLCDGPVPPSACLVPALGAAQDFGVRIEPANTTAQLRLGQLNSLTYCSGQSIALPYTLSGGANSNTETVRAELSDATGGFASATVLTTGTGGLITTELPANLPTASAYRIRLVPANVAIPGDQTPALTIRQSPTGTLLGPSVTNEGQTVSLTLAFTGSGSWQVKYQTTTGIDQYATSLTATASPTLVPILADTYQTIQLLRIENGCPATSTGAALTINPACAPPESLTETMYAWGQTDLNWQILRNRSYVVQWKQQTAANWTTLPTQSWTPAMLTGLVLGQTYQWRVAATCANSLSSAFSPTRTFSFSCLMPENVTEQVTQSSANLRWDGSANTSYLLRWRQAGTTIWTNVSVAFGLYTIPGVVAGRAYEWQVSSVCSNTTSSVFTPLRSFTVTCSPPVYLYAEEITSSSARVSWRTLAGQQYRVRWRAASAATWTTLNWITSDVQSLTGLPGGQTIEWQVQTRCSDASESGFSSGSAFTTLCPAPPVPVVSGIAATSALIQLNPPNATFFFLFYRKAGTTAYSSIFISGGPTTYALTGLDYNTAYEVGLSQSCPNDSRSGQSAPASFTTVNCAPPQVLALSGPPTAIFGQSTTLVATLAGQSPWSLLLTSGESFTGLTTSPVRLVSRLPDFGYTRLNISVARISNACQTVNWPGPYVALQMVNPCGGAPINLRIGQQGTNYVTLLWDVTQRADNYTLQWRQAGGTNWNTVENAYSDYWLSGLTYGQAYEWRVQAVCYQGQPVTPSAIQSFTMSCPLPTGMTELYGPTEARLSWNWQASAGVPVDYTLRWRAAGNPTWTTLPNLSNSNHTLTGLTPDMGYEWQLQTNCIGSGTGPVSPIRSFTTGCGMPQLYYTSNLTSSSVTMNWLSQTPDAQYVLRWRINTPPTSWTTSTTTFTGLAGGITGLQGQSTYDVQLRAVCANGQRSPFTESFYVLTPCSVMYSVRTGNWNDPGTWSCNRIPILGETVQVSAGHTVTIPASTTAYARTVQEYGRLMVAAGAKLQLGL